MWNIIRPRPIPSAFSCMTRRGGKEGSAVRNQHPPCLSDQVLFHLAASTPAVTVCIFDILTATGKGTAVLNQCHYFILSQLWQKSAQKSCQGLSMEYKYSFSAGCAFCFSFFPALCKLGHSAWNRTYLEQVFHHCLHYKSTSFCHWIERLCT